MSDNHGHGHDDGHGHGEHAPACGVIPEGSWQDKLLMGVAAGALAGLLWAGLQATQGITMPAGTEGHTVGSAEGGEGAAGSAVTTTAGEGAAGAGQANTDSAAG